MSNPNRSHYGGPERRQDQSNGISRDDIDRIFSELSNMRETFSQCKKTIGDRVDEKIVEHAVILDMRNKLDDLGVKIETLFTEMYKAVDNGDRRLRGHDEDIQAVWDKISGMQNQIAQLEHICRAASEATVSGFAQSSRQISALHDGQNTAQDTINIVLREIQSLKVRSAPAATGFLAGIKANQKIIFASFAIGLGISIGWYAATTGDFTFITKMGFGG